MSNNVADTNVGKMTPQEEAIERIEELDRFVDKNPSMFEYDDVSFCDYGSALNLAIEALRFQQELVRCKDCASLVTNETTNTIMYVCGKHHYDRTIPNGYCHRGRRREEE